MGSKAIRIVTFLLLLQSYHVTSQQEVVFGLSVNQGFSILSNKDHVVSEQIGSGAITQPSRSYPKGLWHASSFALDTYWSERKIVASIGFNFFRYKYVSDSVLPIYVNVPYYGQKTNSRTVVLPFIRFGYRFKLSERIVYQPSFSFGITEIIENNNSIGIAYDPAGQEGWDNYNRANGGPRWAFGFEKKSFMLEFGNDIVYDLDSWSFSGGLSYYFYRDLPIEGYHGLHLNVGCSVRFGGKNINQKLESND